MKEEIKINDAFKTASLPKRSLLGGILNFAAKGVLAFVNFPNTIVRTSLMDIEEGFKNGGAIKVERSQRLTDDPIRIPEWRLTNSQFSAFYLRSWVEDQLRESLHMIRFDYAGGAILQFTDGSLVGGITNAVRRLYFSKEEQEVAERLLSEARKLIKEIK